MNTDYPKDEVEKAKDVSWHRRGNTERRHHPAREDDAINEERADIAGGEHALHLFQDGVEDGMFVVWLNTESSDFDGLVLGVGDTRDAAVARAVKSLESALAILQSPPPLR